jgi:hypothetical protein
LPSSGEILMPHILQEMDGKAQLLKGEVDTMLKSFKVLLKLLYRVLRIANIIPDFV